MKIELDLRKFIEIDDEESLQPLYPRISNNNLFVGVNIVGKDNFINCSNIVYLLSYNLESQRLNWVLKLIGEGKNRILTGIKELNGALYIATDNYFYSVSKKDGTINWKKKFKNLGNPYISIIDNRLFLTNWGELLELDLMKNRRIQYIKPRVKWFDSEIIQYKNRWFVSTSNSKILELNPNDLTVERDFKFTGKWAVGAKPIIYKDFMVANNYSSKTIIFNLLTNEVEKRFNRKTGSRPMQKSFANNILFYEGNTGQELTLYSLCKFKKIWKKNIERVQYIEKSNCGNIELIYRSEGQYLAGIFDIGDGSLIRKSIISKYKGWSNVKFDLWRGVGIIVSDRYRVYCFEPNLITVTT